MAVIPMPFSKCSLLRPSKKKTRHGSHWVGLLQLPALKNLVYVCANQFSPCLLDALHNFIPDCRLHIWTFDLRILHQDGPQPQDIDEYEYALATSPSPCSIRVRCGDHDEDGLANYNKEAAFEIGTRLEKVSVHFNLNKYSTGNWYYNTLSPRPARNGLFLRDHKQEKHPMQRGSIQSLTFEGHRHTERCHFGGTKSLSPTYVPPMLRPILPAALDRTQTTASRH